MYVFILCDTDYENIYGMYVAIHIFIDVSYIHLQKFHCDHNCIVIKG